MLPICLHLFAALGGGSIAFPEPQIPVAPEARSPRAGDLDGDGWADVVAVDRAGDALLVARNACGTLLPPTSHPTGPTPGSVRLARVNADAVLDAVVAWTGGASGGLSIHLGDGLGGFGARMDFPLSVVPAELVLSDLDGDGDVDALVLGAAPDDALVLARLGDGAGGLGPEVATGLGVSASAFDVGDLDGDAVDDLFASVPQLGASELHLLSGLGDGSFVPVGILAVDDLPLSVAVGDLDGDGHDDVSVMSLPSVLSPGTLTRYLGDGTGQFGLPYSVPTGVGPPDHALADVDGDDRLDVVAEFSSGPGLLPSQFLVHFGDGGGGFEPFVRVSTRPDAQGFDFAELDAVPGLDLVYVQAGDPNWTSPVGFLGTVQQVEPRRFDAASVFQTGFFSGVQARSADVDRDGFDDVVAVGSTGSTQNALVVLRGDGSGGFLAPRRTPYPRQLPTGPQSLTLADVGTDGLLDAVVLEGAELLVFAGRPDGSFAAPWTTALPTFLGVADLDGDGRGELLEGRAAGGGANEVAILRFTGSALTELAAVPTVGAPQIARAADVDGDGTLDLLLHVANPGSVEVHRGAGGFGFFPPSSVRAPQPVFDLVAADLDGDGLPEVVGSPVGRSALAIWWNRGGQLAAPVRHAVGQGPSALASADLDGDGRDEVIAAHLVGLNIAVVGQGPDGPLAPARFFAVPRFATSLDAFRRAPAAPSDILFATGGFFQALIFEAFGLLPNAAHAPR